MAGKAKSYAERLFDYPDVGFDAFMKRQMLTLLKHVPQRRRR